MRRVMKQEGGKGERQANRKKQIMHAERVIREQKEKRESN